MNETIPVSIIRNQRLTILTLSALFFPLLLILSSYANPIITYILLITILASVIFVICGFLSDIIKEGKYKIFDNPMIFIGYVLFILAMLPLLYFLIYKFLFELDILKSVPSISLDNCINYLTNSKDSKQYLTYLMIGLSYATRYSYFICLTAVLISILTALVAIFQRHMLRIKGIRKTIAKITFNTLNIVSQSVECIPAILLICILLPLSQKILNINPYNTPDLESQFNWLCVYEGLIIGIACAPSIYRLINKCVDNIECSDFIKLSEINSVTQAKIVWHHIIRTNSMSKILTELIFIWGFTLILEISLNILLAQGNLLPTWNGKTLWSLGRMLTLEENLFNLVHMTHGESVNNYEFYNIFGSLIVVICMTSGLFFIQRGFLSEEDDNIRMIPINKLFWTDRLLLAKHFKKAEEQIKPHKNEKSKNEILKRQSFSEKFEISFELINLIKSKINNYEYTINELSNNIHDEFSEDFFFKILHNEIQDKDDILNLTNIMKKYFIPNDSKIKIDDFIKNIEKEKENYEQLLLAMEDKLNEILSRDDFFCFLKGFIRCNHKKDICEKAKFFSIEIDHINLKQDEITGISDSLKINIYNKAFNFLIGQSGSGKSITALAMSSLLDRRKWNYPELGTNLSFSYIFQEPKSYLDSNFTIEDQLLEAFYSVNKEYVKNSVNFNKDVIELLHNVKLINKISDSNIDFENAKTLMNKYPHQLSGGERQRVMIAMAMASTSKEDTFLIADEPTSSLDFDNQDNIIKTLHKLLENETFKGIILITHDKFLIKKYWDLWQKEENNSVRCTIYDFENRSPINYKTLDDDIKKIIQEHYDRLDKGDDLLKITEFTTINYRPKNKEKLKLIKIDNELSVKENEIFGIIGGSGCGKTTLINYMLGFLSNEWECTPEKPNLNIDTYDNKDFNKGNLQAIFQDPDQAFNPNMTIKEIFNETYQTFKPGINEPFEVWLKNILQEANLISEANLNSFENIIHRYSSQFSGGQLQRLTLMRAIAAMPRLIVADEPFSRLDMKNKFEMVKLMKNKLAERKEQEELKKMSYIIASHDLETSSIACDKIAVLKKGEKENGPTIIADIIVKIFDPDGNFFWQETIDEHNVNYSYINSIIARLNEMSLSCYKKAFNKIVKKIKKQLNRSELLIFNTGEIEEVVKILLVKVVKYKIPEVLIKNVPFADLVDYQKENKIKEIKSSKKKAIIFSNDFESLFSIGFPIFTVKKFTTATKDIYYDLVMFG